MSFEDDLKETFMRHGTDVKPRASASWNDIERGVRRAHHRRFAAVTGVAVAIAIAGVVIAVPKLRGTSDPGTRGFANTPSSQPTPNCDAPNACATATPVAALPNTYRDSMDGWQIGYASDWKMSRFEGHTTFSPRTEPSIESGQPTYAVDVWLERGIDLTQAVRDSGRQGWTDTTVAGQTAKRAVNVPNNGSHQRYLLVDWGNEFCSDSRCPVPSEGVLHVSTSASTAALEETFGPTGDAMVQSLITADAGFPSPPVTTRAGTVTVAFDAYTQELVRFLEARTTGTGAEQFAIDRAATAYEQHSGGLDLYSNTETKQPWQSYVVTARTDGTGCTGPCTEFSVRISDGADGMIEKITVGRSEGGTILITDAAFAGRFP